MRPMAKTSYHLAHKQTMRIERDAIERASECCSSMIEPKLIGSLWPRSCNWGIALCFDMRSSWRFDELTMPNCLRSNLQMYAMLNAVHANPVDCAVVVVVVVAVDCLAAC